MIEGSRLKQFARAICDERHKTADRREAINFAELIH